MPIPPLVVAVDEPALRAGLARIREQFDVPGEHGPGAVAEAERAAAAVLGGLAESTRRHDVRDLPFVTIDPPGSRDLDQAVHIEARRGGWRLRYAVADVPAFVTAGGALDGEAHDRGLTVYLPDRRAPLHPAVLGEGAASLLAGQDRPAVLWTIDLDGAGQVDRVRFGRALVRSQAQLTYEEVQSAVDAGTASGTIALLAEVGVARQALEAARDGVSLDLPTQRIEPRDHGWALTHEQVVPAMGWNAQVSLLTGMVAAEAMLTGGVGLLRTLPPPERSVVARVRRTAKALGVEWPEGASYQAVVRSLRSADPDQAALLDLAARGLRGAGYLALTPGQPAPTGRDTVEHAAVAAPYAHVTAPLRRLCDRAAIEVCLALFEGAEVPSTTLGALADLPAEMARAGGRANGAARAAVDLVESLLLRDREDEVLDATVVASDDEQSSLILRALAVEATIDEGGLPLGETIQVRVHAVDVIERRVDLRLVRWPQRSTGS